ncbi:MAG TPA: hypothetical protein VEQ65_06355, partial [Opitutus sp.]|nr:hypothetical protein [Opitutus sp.]
RMRPDRRAQSSQRGPGAKCRGHHGYPQATRGGKILEIELLDHVIVGDCKGDPLHRGVYSFREAGLI